MTHLSMQPPKRASTGPTTSRVTRLSSVIRMEHSHGTLLASLFFLSDRVNNSPARSPHHLWKAKRRVSTIAVRDPHRRDVLAKAVGVNCEPMAEWVDQHVGRPLTGRVATPLSTAKSPT